MVVGQNALDAHYYERETGAILPLGRLVVVGTNDGGHSDALQYLPFTTSGSLDSFTPDVRHERQIPLIGAQTQEALSKAVVAVVGLGGLGSFVALELAYLGVGRLVLIDHDCVEPTNLNRLIGAQESDIGRPKVEVFVDLINRVSPMVEVSAVHAPLLASEALDEAKGVDLLLGCVDSNGARLALNHLAIRYLIPYLDAGTGVRLGEDSVPSSVGGQVQLVAPGVGCLECRGFINPRRAAFDLATPEMQEYERSHGYGTQETAPSVVFLNGVMASMQVAEAVRLLTASWGGGEGCPRMVLYDAPHAKSIHREIGVLR